MRLTYKQMKRVVIGLLILYIPVSAIFAFVTASLFGTFLPAFIFCAFWSLPMSLLRCVGCHFLALIAKRDT